MVRVLDFQDAESGFSKVQASDLHCILVAKSSQSSSCNFSALWKMNPVSLKELQCFINKLVCCAYNGMVIIK